MLSALFGDIIQILDLSTLEDGTEMLSRSLGMELQLYVE